METLSLFPQRPEPIGRQMDRQMNRQINRAMPSSDPHMKIAQQLASVLEERALRARAVANHSSSAPSMATQYAGAKTSDVIAHAICDHLLASLKQDDAEGSSH